MNIPIDNYRAEIQTLGADLRKERLAHKLTMQQVADILNIDEATVSKIETGKWNASITFYISMAQVYNKKIKLI